MSVKSFQTAAEDFTTQHLSIPNGLWIFTESILSPERFDKSVAILLARFSEEELLKQWKSFVVFTPPGSISWWEFVKNLNALNHGIYGPSLLAEMALIVNEEWGRQWIPMFKRDVSLLCTWTGTRNELLSSWEVFVKKKKSFGHLRVDWFMEQIGHLIEEVHSGTR